MQSPQLVMRCNASSFFNASLLPHAESNKAVENKIIISGFIVVSLIISDFLNNLFQCFNGYLLIPFFGYIRFAAHPVVG